MWIKQQRHDQKVLQGLLTNTEREEKLHKRFKSTVKLQGEINNLSITPKRLQWFIQRNNCRWNKADTVSFCLMSWDLKCLTRIKKLIFSKQGYRSDHYNCLMHSEDINSITDLRFYYQETFKMYLNIFFFIVLCFLRHHLYMLDVGFFTGYVILLPAQ